MKAAWKRVLGTALVALFVVTGTATLAFAAPGEGPMPRMVLAYISGKTGATMAELIEEFKAGMTLPEICEAHGVEWSLVEALGGPGTGQRVANLEERIARLIENQTKVQEHLTRAEAAVERLQERIPAIEDPTQRGFAQRQLDILVRRVEQITARLDLMADQLELLQDMLEYKQSI